tara:strand:- start:4004 stop:4312 length:309 start_codon:yes stop_codon:yes gene_type:complete
LKKRFKYQFYLIAVLAITGLIGSITHYHSEGLECLDHAEEQHYVQNDNYCPICTLVVSGDFDIQISTEVILLSDEHFFFYDEFFPSTSHFYLNFGRAPPFIA